MENPWLKLVPADGEFLLSIDRVAVETHNTTAKEQHKFRLDMVPEPYMGRPDAPIVVLTGNPRFRADDLETHARPEVQELLLACARREELEFPLVWMDPRLADTPGAVWYQQKLRLLCQALGPKAVAQGVAIYESLPYHSAELKQPRMSIPSQNYTNELAGTALDQDRIVIWLRGPWDKLLGSSRVETPSVIRPRSSQVSHLSPGNLSQQVFDRMVDALR